MTLFPVLVEDFMIAYELYRFEKGGNHWSINYHIKQELCNN